VPAEACSLSRWLGSTESGIVRKANPTRSINRLVKYHRKWVADNFERIHLRETKSLEQDLADASLHALANISYSLDALATCYGIRSTIGLVDGNQQSWVDVHRAASYRLWGATLGVEGFKRIASSIVLTNDASQVACNLCYAIASGRTEWAARQASFLSYMATTDFALSKGYWASRRFEPFALHFYDLAQGSAQGDSDDIGAMGLYGEVVRNWAKPELLAASLTEICDFHCGAMEDHGGRDPEFDHPPFDLIPWEILAVYQARSSLGLETPPIQHPLLFLCGNPDQWRYSDAEDVWLSRVKELASRLSLLS
jgi:hypothetical protein